MVKKRITASARRGSSSNEGMRACSACAGDYEDPDRTAWAPDGDEDVADATDDGAGAKEHETARDRAAEEFPAEEQ